MPHSHRMKTATCTYCGAEFQHRQSREQRYCSNSCRARAMPRPTPPASRPRSVEIMCPLNWRTCVDCGKEWLLQPGHHPKRCEDCRTVLSREASKAYSRAKFGHMAHSKACPTCGTQFTGHGGKVFCSRLCHHSSPEYQNGRRLQRAKRERGLTVVERFDPTEIYERDGFRCQLCGRKLALGKAVPHPDAPTLDHILPIAHGGKHERANVQAAHFRCNAARQHRGAAQLRLA